MASSCSLSPEYCVSSFVAPLDIHVFIFVTHAACARKHMIFTMLSVLQAMEISVLPSTVVACVGAYDIQNKSLSSSCISCFSEGYER